ncbi:MAG: UDP-N-acetylmuramate dehydrogenase [Myxococcales bacterium]|nr:UDP-N-acetylmuramate dehydrogenase [Polyangiaceae bacterium]MDW8251502.1 UDP-N-acetylmuramate dehydrogenase [Myxococcales bacterium]
MSVVLHQEPLAPRTSFRLGGPARILIEADRDDEIESILREQGTAPLFVLGGGSNLLVADRGYDGLVLAIRSRGVSLRRDGDAVLVTAAAGEPWDDLVARCVEEGLAGIECLSGIPGQVGATPIQNVGAYGQEVSDTLVAVHAYDRMQGQRVSLRPEECSFAYRDSAFKSQWPGRYVILSVVFRLRPGLPDAPRYGELIAALGDEPPTLGRLRSLVIELRRRKGMILDEGDPDTRSAGSFFTNPILEPAAWAAFQDRIAPQLHPGERIPSFDGGGGRIKLAAAWLIERAGFSRGFQRGGAAVSSRHALALVNRGGSAADVLALAREIQQGVREAFGVELTPEPVLLGF